MCGIAGEWDWEGAPPVPGVIDEMIASLAHRGPEGRASWFSADSRLALAHAQLSFFNGAKTQPVSNANGTIFVVCNGEIYNHRELTGLVIRSGIDCDIRFDVEIIPYLYQLRGPSCFELLRGEFAFALYDGLNRSLYLVRDRFGIKPLYYHATTTSVMFGSEIKALFANPRVPRVFDNASIAGKLLFITLPGNTCFSKIREVKPGSFVQLNPKEIREQPYWSLNLEGAAATCDPNALEDRFLTLFDEAVRARLHGDFPVGAYLSGGIDSCAVLAAMVHQGAKSVKAFTISFEDKLFDESRTAAAVAARLDVEHHIVHVRHTDIAKNFLHSIWHSEIPIMNSHGVAKFMLSRAASAHVKAVMTGEGADELFAGYPYFGASEGLTGRTDLRQQVINWWNLLTSGEAVLSFPPIAREKDINRLLPLFGCAPYLGRRTLLYGRVIRTLLDNDFRKHFSPRTTLELVAQDFRSHTARAVSQTNADRYLAIKYDLPAYILNFLADRQEMAHSIEGRVPFLDDNIVAFASTLGDESLIGDASGKRLIRRALAKRLPLQVLATPKKTFLAPPTAVDEILRSDWAHHLLSKAVTDAVGIFDWRRVAQLKGAAKLVPRRSGIGTLLRTLLILLLSVHALHHLFIAGRSRS